MQDTDRKLIFSCISGYNMYVPSKDGAAELMHFFSNEDVYIKYSEVINECDIQEKWKYLIEHPVDIKRFLWPIDVVRSNVNLSYGLVYKKRPLPVMVTLKKLLYLPESLGLNNTVVKNLVKNLLLAFSDLHSCGYAYHSFDIEKIRYCEANGDVLFEFPMAISILSKKKFLLTQSAIDDIKIEFLPPWRKIESSDAFVPEDDYFSIAAILFKLITGRMPFQGRLMDGYGDMMVEGRDVDPDMHIRMFQHYHDNPVFIFDKNNRSNSIGSIGSEERIVNIWNKLPDRIRNMFSSVFDGNNLSAAYKGKRVLYSADEWLNALVSERLIDGE